MEIHFRIILFIPKLPEFNFLSDFLQCEECENGKYRSNNSDSNLNKLSKIILISRAPKCQLEYACVSFSDNQES